MYPLIFMMFAFFTLCEANVNSATQQKPPIPPVQECLKYTNCSSCLEKCDVWCSGNNKCFNKDLIIYCVNMTTTCKEKNLMKNVIDPRFTITDLVRLQEYMKSSQPSEDEFIHEVHDIWGELTVKEQQQLDLFMKYCWRKSC